MLEATRLAREYVASMSKADFLVDRRTQQAVVLNLITSKHVAERMELQFQLRTINHWHCNSGRDDDVLDVHYRVLLRKG